MRERQASRSRRITGFRPGSNASAQMEFYLSLLDPVKGERVVIDYEQDGCTLAMLRHAVQALLDYRHELQITVYSAAIC